ncbi:MAG: hypothetical protein MUO29_08590, partial [Desulfobacterales bacterium]|nr:hypothetical protein [Desulfobacterales bacterium]
MKKLSLATVCVFCLFWMVGGAFAATDSKVLTVNATVSARATLTLGVATINFPDSDPTTVPSISATENPVSVTAKVRTGAASTATLTCIAGGALISGTDTIAISNVTWTAGGNGFVGGTMSSTLGQSAGSWTGSGNNSSTFSYSLANSWSYAAG